MTDLPSRFNATPAEIDAHLRSILAEDVYLRFQQTIGEHAIAQTVEDAGAVRAAADNEGLYNNDWREGWDDAIDRAHPDQNGPYPVKLIEFHVAVEPQPVSRALPPRDAVCANPECRHSGADHHHGDTKCWARLPRTRQPNGAWSAVPICSCAAFQPSA
ncbi:hypothetical protein [Streptomyces naphthomycinicus]|uniref:hypothetical protein n=1 Tax=Streptomyces naphthomycinicus TaxID=2872625 RepID=UPI001CED5D7F|nr:hypothetical protein [Streptomyces sp. TML10]